MNTDHVKMLVITNINTAYLPELMWDEVNKIYINRTKQGFTGIGSAASVDRPD